MSVARVSYEYNIPAKGASFSVLYFDLKEEFVEMIRCRNLDVM